MILPLHWLRGCTYILLVRDIYYYLMADTWLIRNKLFQLTARFSMIRAHPFLSSRLAGIPGVKTSLLEEFGIHLVTYDLPGFGESDPHPNRNLQSSTGTFRHILLPKFSSPSSIPSFIIPPSSLPFPLPSVSPISTSLAPFSVPSFSPVLPTSASQPVVQSSPSVISPSHRSSHSMITRSKSGITVPKVPFSFLVQSPPVTEPVSFKEAMAFPEWRKAMTDEYSALMSQGTWSLGEPCLGAPIIGCKWVFRIKKNSDGTVARYKARLVAQGFQQTEGVDYSGTFSPVVKQPTIRVVLSLALHFDWPIRQLDVSNAFLHGQLQEQVFLRQPQGYVNAEFPNHVCHLHKALYGLKQAPRAWYDMLSKHLLRLGFQNSQADSSLFVYHQHSDLVYVLVYVDDLLFTGNNEVLIDNLVTKLSTAFALKDLGPLHYFLGIEVIPSSTGLILSQQKYALDLLARASMLDCRPCSTPSSLRPDPDSASSLMPNPEFYRSLVGSLQYLTITRPDLSYAVNSVC